MQPLVSCILSTRNRRRFFEQAVRCFLDQSYRERELIVVDDGEDAVGDLCDGLPNTKYLRLAEPTPTGRKLNLGIAEACGSVVQNIDDDDYYGPGFLQTAVASLTAESEPHSVVAWCCFLVLITGDPHLYASGHGWHAGGTLCFRRLMWERQPFREAFRSYDTWFLRDNNPKIVRACAREQYIVVRHGRNTWTRVKGFESVEDYFRGRRHHTRPIEEVVGVKNTNFYRSLMSGG